MDEWNRPEGIDWKLKWLTDEQEIAANTECSFCGKRRDQVEQLTVGPGKVYICNGCVDLCREYIENRAGLPTSTEKFWHDCSSCGICVPTSHRYCYNCGSQFTQEAGCVKSGLSMATVEKPSVVVPAD